VVRGAESEAEITPCHRSYIVVDPYTLNTVCVRFARFHSYLLSSTAAMSMNSDSPGEEYPLLLPHTTDALPVHRLPK
jgi:hypothetical protein